MRSHDNSAADRIAALKVIGTAPEVPLLARENRRFLGRVVNAEAGVEQFLDLATGLPTEGNAHQVAGHANPAARVVYVDNDPMLRPLTGAEFRSRARSGCARP